MAEGLIWKIKQLNDFIEKYSRAYLKTLNLTLAQAIILNDLWQRQDQTTYAKDLQQHLGMSKSFISTTLKALKQKGYIQITEDKQDDRKKALVLTSQAVACQAEIAGSLQMLQSQLEEMFEPEHLTILESDLECLLRKCRASNERREGDAESIISTGERV